MELARDVGNDELGGVVAGDFVIVDEPLEEDFIGIRLGVTGKSHLGALLDAPVGKRAADDRHDDLRRELHFEFQSCGFVCSVGGVLRLTRDCRVVVLLLGNEFQN
jgi:hypothetical protein